MDSIVYTNENCIGCNKCIKVCSAIGACVSKEEDGKARIVVDGSKCVACGSCIDVCEHHAREFSDDTDRFFEDLKRGDNISLLLAPAFKANYPDRYESVLGGLKAMGVNRIISVSFGADITTWGYINYIKKHDFYGGISQPCPAVVSYIEHYIPELIPKLFPVQSPLMCAAIYARQEMKITDKLAFISPCIAKKIEIDDPNNRDLVQYNVTFEHLMRYVEDHKIEGKPTASEIEYGLGSFYPTPGGLAENVRWFLGDDVFIRQIEGEKHLYEWMHRNKEVIEESRTPFLFIDALNCEKGCICGTAVDNEKSKTDKALYELLKIREEAKKNTSGDAWSRPDSPEERLNNYNKQFDGLNLDDYLRGYSDLSKDCMYKIPDEKELDEVFVSMNKLTDESRTINCTCCGYNSCRQMAIAIYNGFNHKDNCLYYEKAMIAELEIEKKIAEEATIAKSAFLANMSHEIRTPINAVLGMDELILRECDEESIREYASNIKRSGNMLLSLINNILDFSKIEAGKMELIADKYDMAFVIKDAIAMVRPRAEEKGLKLYCKVDEEVPRYLFGDSVRVKQCMINILTNAVKYTDMGSVTLSVSLSERSDRMALLRVSIKDTGIGIKEADIERLFGAFERIDLEKNRTVEGTGLGMNIVQRLLEMMGSRLAVTSEYGKGSEFSFELRQGVISDEKIESIDEHTLYTDSGDIYRKKFIAPDARILVVDDSEMNLRVVEGLLKQTLIAIDSVLSGEEALKCIERVEYDVLFVDHMMPEMDGIELLHKLRTEYSSNPNASKPCIILTANAVSGARELYIREGFDDYMSKPVDGRLLEGLLMRYLPKDKYTVVRDEALEKNYPEDDFAKLELDGIDTAQGIRNCGSGEDYKSALGVFYSSIDEKASEITALYEAEDWQNYTIKVHALKSTGRIIGADAFADRAQMLEDAGKRENIEYIRENHDGLVSDFLKFKEILSPVCAVDRYGNNNGPLADACLIEEVYNAVREGADNLDIYAVEEALSEIEGYSLPEGDREVIDTLRTYCENFDYDGMIRLLKDQGRA